MQPPLSTTQRLAMVAVGYIQRGLTQAQTVAAIQQRFGWADQAAAQDAYNAALGAVGAAVGASLLPSGSTVGEARGIPAGEDRTVQVEALVTISRPGAQPEHRTVRLTASSDDSLAEVQDRIQDIVDDWSEMYDADGRASRWDLRFIL